MRLKPQGFLRGRLLQSCLNDILFLLETTVVYHCYGAAGHCIRDLEDLTAQIYHIGGLDCALSSPDASQTAHTHFYSLIVQGFALYTNFHRRLV